RGDFELERVIGMLGSGNGLQEAHVAVGQLRELLDLKREGTQSVLDAPWAYALSAANTRRVRMLASGVLQAERELEEGNPRSAAVTLRSILKDVVWVKNMLSRMSSPTSAHEIVGGFKVITMPQVKYEAVPAMREMLAEAARLIHPHFPQVLYGEVFFSNVVAHGLAHYISATDILYIGGKSGEVGQGMLHAICHELGHRYEEKFWKDKAQKDAFKALTFPKPVREFREVSESARRAFAEEILEAVRAKRQTGRDKRLSKPLQEHLKYLQQAEGRHFQQLLGAALRGGAQEEQAVRDLVVPGGLQRKKPVVVTPYGATSASENFAEAFSFFVRGKPLPFQIQEIMDQLH
ncbi:MAG: hypothetical protein Q8P59_11265, partial [Dehalococcoidia bacterium]|nr:hypothetical protein [Dehalococcoidia bacterium]